MNGFSETKSVTVGPRLTATSMRSAFLFLSQESQPLCSLKFSPFVEPPRVPPAQVTPSRFPPRPSPPLLLPHIFSSTLFGARKMEPRPQETTLCQQVGQAGLGASARDR